nr:MAG TPA: hypothetical protein [Bacteriophage sp.]
MNKYIIIYRAFDGLTQVEGSAKYDSYCQAQVEIMKLEKKYGKSMKFQVCKIMDTNND